MATPTCPRCRSADTTPHVRSSWQCENCGAIFTEDGDVTYQGQRPASPAPSRGGFRPIQNADGVTVGYVQAEDNEVRSSLTMGPDGEAMPAVEADPVAAKNTLLVVEAAEAANRAVEAAKSEEAGTKYVVDDEGKARKVGGDPDAAAPDGDQSAVAGKREAE